MKKTLQILSVLLLSCLAVVLFGVANHQEAKASGPWACVTNGGNKASWQNSGVIKACDDFFVYDPVLSGNAKQPVFVSGKSAGSDDGNHGPVFELTLAKDANGNLGYVLKDAAGQTTSGDYIDQNNLASVPFVATDTKKEFCSIIKSTNCDPYNGDKVVMQDGTLDGGHAGGFNINTATYTGAGIDGAAYIAAINKQAAKDSANNGNCIDSPLSFFLCPVRDFLVSTFGSTIDVMVKLLQNPTVSKDAGVGKALASFTTLANSFYVLIFLFIILANFVNIPGLDNYTIKKLLPKLIAAIILTQFSFVICGAVLDIANIAAVTLPKYILQAFNITGTPGEAFANAVLPLSCLKTGSCASNVLTAGKELGQFMLLQITLIVGIVVALISLVYIVFRYLFLAILIIFAPLAFAAWVLPNTEKYFKEWWKYFIKLSIMFLLVNLLLVFGAVFSKIFDPAANGLGGSGFDQFIATLIDVVIPLVILFLIPKTLKISGDIMTSTGKLVGGAVAGSTAGKAGISAVKKSNQEGKLAEIRGGAQEKFGKKIGNVGMEARGKVLARQKANKEKEAVSQLGLSRQIELANGGNATARSAINSKLSDLSNKRVLTGQEYHDLYRLQRNAIDPNDPQYQAKITALDAQFADMNQLQYDPNDSNKVISYNTLSNPLYASTGTNTPTGTPTPAGGGGAGAGAGAAPGGGGGGRPAPAAAPGGTGTSGTATPGTGAGPGQARSSAAQFNRGARAGRAATGSSAAPLSNPNATPPPNPAGGPPGGGGTPPAPPAGPPPGFPGP